LFHESFLDLKYFYWFPVVLSVLIKMNADGFPMSVASFLGSVNPRLIFLIVFVTVLGALLYRDREKVQRQSILFYRRTKHGVETIDRIAKAAPRFWNAYGWVGVVFGVLTVPFILWNVFLSFSQMLSTNGATGGPSFIAPGLSGETALQSGVSFIPIEYWLISIGILMVVHEMSHGIVARAEDMEINSVGWIVLGIIPGAFVEPKGENMLPDPDAEEGEGEEDQEEDSGGLWDQGSWTSQLKVLTAGSFANYITAVVFAALALLMFMNIAQPAGVQYSAQDGYPAINAGMDNGTIYELDDERIRYSGQAAEVFDRYEPGDTVTINSSEGVFNVTLADRNGSAHLGIYMVRNEGLLPTLSDMINDNREIRPEYSRFEGVFSWTLGLFQTVALLNFLIGMFNLLPAKPLDGGQMVQTVLDRFYPEGVGALNYWSLIIWAALLLALVYGIAGPLL